MPSKLIDPDATDDITTSPEIEEQVARALASPWFWMVLLSALQSWAMVQLAKAVAFAYIVTTIEGHCQALVLRLQKESYTDLKHVQRQPWPGSIPSRWTARLLSRDDESKLNSTLGSCLDGLAEVLSTDVFQVSCVDGDD